MRSGARLGGSSLQNNTRDGAGESSKAERSGTPGRAATERELCLRYFIRFTCYGGRLHGDESGSVDRHHNLVGSRRLEPDVQRVMAARRKMLQHPYVLDATGRTVVLAAIRKHCVYRGWNLLAAHVRS